MLAVTVADFVSETLYKWNPINRQFKVTMRQCWHMVRNCVSIRVKLRKSKMGGTE